MQGLHLGSKDLYNRNKRATALSNIHPVVIVIDDVGIVLSCNIQDDMILHY